VGTGDWGLWALGTGHTHTAENRERGAQRECVGVKKKKMAVWAILPLFPPFSREAFAGPGHTHTAADTHTEREGRGMIFENKHDSTLSLLFEQRTTRTTTTTQQE
jgi:hypothetical protein